VNEDERDRAGVGRGYEGGQDDKSGRQDGHHVGQEGVRLVAKKQSILRQHKKQKVYSKIVCFSITLSITTQSIEHSSFLSL
jgi:hypothetical protein